MGYNTQFKGSLKFTSEPNAAQLAALGEILGEDPREQVGWDAGDLYGIDLELTRDYLGLQWSGAEKSYDMPAQVNLVIRLMRRRWPDFGLSGEMKARGEDFDDNWILRMEAPDRAVQVARPV